MKNRRRSVIALGITVSIPWIVFAQAKKPPVLNLQYGASTP